MNHFVHPPTPLTAAAHPDPYPWYAEVVAHRPFAWDPQLGIWVAGDAASVTAILASPLCRVRPPAEPVPAALRGTAAGALFADMARMTDGPRHTGLKHALTAALATLAPARVQATSWSTARVLAAPASWRHDPDALSAFAFRLPVAVCAQLIGLPEQHLALAARLTGAFARCLAPAASALQVERGARAAAQLRALIDAQQAPAPDTLMATLRAALPPALTAAFTANVIGLLAQSYEATAGLLGNTVVALARRPQVVAWLCGRPDGLAQVLHEVLRYDPPIQTTRRVAAAAGWIAGREIRAGQTILLLLAAANRDPQANPQPERFDPARRARRSLSFGAGAHACPGQALALLIAEAGLAALLEAGLPLAHFADPAAYQPSANARIPLWGRAADTAIHEEEDQ